MIFVTGYIFLFKKKKLPRNFKWKTKKGFVPADVIIQAVGLKKK